MPTPDKGDHVFFNGYWYHRSNLKNLYNPVEDKKWERIKENIKKIEDQEWQKEAEG
jgi:polyphosphate kinase 2 (PPK2 family)